ncbi:MAG: DUF952 domain-containing protein [Anaerolineaceae bacterium]|nr:DUF952 domain-containing protein [Anaerolineaceae bacterium]
MTIIYHILTVSDWETAKAAGSYHPPSLDDEGFIHAAYVSQTLDVANILYPGQTDLVLLCIELSKVTARFQEDLVEFPPGTKSLHPHFYEALNTNSVVKVVDFPVGVDGQFTMPPDALL